MKLADQIREYVDSQYIQPARKLNCVTEVTLRAGDIHKELQLNSRMPAVCGALDAQKFQDDFNITLIERSGPVQGANAFFKFKVI